MSDDPDRQFICVDVETSGLDPNAHIAVEVAWWNLSTDQRGRFIPPHSESGVREAGEPEALRINRYIDRIAGCPQDVTGEGRDRLGEQLHGNTLAGSNPAFDESFLRPLYRDHGIEWHHRKWDLATYAAGVLGLKSPPGLAAVCELLGVTPGDHTAEGDVMATGLCFLRLFRKAGIAVPGLTRCTMWSGGVRCDQRPGLGSLCLMHDTEGSYDAS